MRLSQLKIKPPPIRVSPIAIIGAAAVTGTTAASLCTGYTGPIVAIGLSVAIIGSILGVFVEGTIRTTALLCMAISGLFFARFHQAAQAAPPAWVAVLEGELVELVGTACSRPKTENRTSGRMSMVDNRKPITRFDATVTPVSRGTKTGASTLDHANVSAIPVTIHVRLNGTTLVQKGDEIKILGRLRRPSREYETHATVFVSSSNHISIEKTSSSLRHEVEKTIRHKITGGISGREETVLKTIFFGGRDGNWRELSTTFRVAGLSHILAVSGLHIAIIVLSISWVLRATSLGRAVVLCSVFVTASMLFMVIDQRPPVYRALVMVLIFSSLQFRGERFSGIGVLSLVAMMLLWSSPRSIQSASFVLSFTVVLCLCLFFPALQWKLVGPRDTCARWTETVRHKLSSLWVLGLCAMFTALPLTTHFFGSVALAGLFTNIGGVAMLFLLLITGLIRLFVGWIHPEIDFVLLQCLQLVASTMVDTVEFFGSAPCLYVETKPTGRWCAVVTLLALAGLATSTRRSHSLVAITVIVGMYVPVQHQNDVVRLTTLRVGHGTCHILQDRETTILIDAGSRHNLDVGVNTIAPALLRLGVEKIEKIILTHSDLDHCSGVLDVIHLFDTEELVLTPHSLQHPTRVVEHIIREAKGLGTAVSTVEEGWKLQTENAHLLAVWPLTNTVYRSANEASAVLQIQIHGRSILLTGDIDEQTIHTLLHDDLPPADVLELPHHGQWSKESVILLNKLQPVAALQSTSAFRHARDKWTIPPNTDRYVTCIDGTTTTTVDSAGFLKICTDHTGLATVYCDDSSIN